jgi:hypothetical protein
MVLGIGRDFKGGVNVHRFGSLADKIDHGAD